MTSYVKQIPTLIVIGISGYVVYTVFFPDGEPGPPPSESKATATGKVKPAVASNLLRNPFLMDRPVASAGGADAEEVSDAEKPGAEEKLAAAPAEEDRVLEAMKLVGTFVDSREQLAIIDNKVYTRGDQLRGIDGSLLPYVITEVRKDRALVRRGRREFTIAFSDVPRTAAPRAIGPAKSQDGQAPASALAGATFTPIPRSGKGAKPGAAGQAGNDPASQREMLMQLLSSIGAQGGAGGATGGNPLAGLGSAGAASALNGLINPSSLGAGLDALSGKLDNIGQEGATGP